MRLSVVAAVVAVVLVRGWTLLPGPALLAAEAAPAAASGQRKSTPVAITQYRAAVALQNRGVYDLAADEWQGFLKRFPHDPLAGKARHYLGVCYLQAKDYGQARKALEKVIATYPRFELLEATYMNLALAQFNQGQTGDGAALEQAVATFAALRTRFPRGKHLTEALFYQAEALYALGKKAEATKSYQKLLAGDVKDALRSKTLYGLGVVQQETGDDAGAGATFDRFLSEFPKDPLAPEVSVRRADTLRAAGQLADAEQRFATVASTPDSPLADYALLRQAQCREGQNDQREAARLYAMLIAKFPQSTHVRSARVAAGRCLLRAGELAKARQWLTQVGPADVPAGTEAAHWLAQSWLQDGKPAEALRVVEAALPHARDDALTALLKMDRADALHDQPARRKESVALYVALAQDASEPTLAAQAAYMAAYAARETQRYADAVQYAETFLQKHRDHELALDVRQVQAESLFQLKKYEQAIACLQECVATQPNGQQADAALLLLAQAQRQAGQPGAAVATLDRFCRELPQSRHADQAHFLRGQLKAAAGDTPGAIADYQRVCATWPQSPLLPDALFGLGWAQLSTEQLAAAEATMTTLLESHGGHKLAVQARYGRATARQQTGKYAAAIDDVRAVLEANPASSDRANALYVRGLCEAGLKRTVEAIGTLEAVLKQEPNFAAADRVLYELAWAYRESRQLQRAAETFARLAREHPDSPLAAECLFRVGEAEYEHQRYAQAATQYARAKDKADDALLREKALHKLGWAWFQQRDFDRASKAFRDQVQQLPSGSLATDALVMIGEVLFQQQRYERAGEAFSRARAHGKPASSAQLQVLALLHAGQSAAQQQAWDESLALLTECAEQYPESEYRDEVLYEQGWVKQNQGKLDEAKKLYEQVADRGQSVLAARARFMIGEIQFQQKAHRDAVRSFFKVAYGYGAAQAPKAFHVWQANSLFEAARCLEQLDKPAAAKRLYAELVQQYPDSDKAADAHSKLAVLGELGQ